MLSVPWFPVAREVNGATGRVAAPGAAPAYFNDAMSITKRYFTSLFSMRS
jgi:hypothetical protein